jgi:YD repeat-containing protein
LIAVEQPDKNVINFKYSLSAGMPPESANGNVVEVDYNLGNRAVFNYSDNSLLSITFGARNVSYTYNENNMITGVQRANGERRKYHYEDTRFPTALTGITDERGARYATWTYDAQGRAISSEHAGGAEKTLLAFNADGSTTVTNALNKKTIYRFDDIAGARRVTKVEGQPTTNCIGANQDYTYTAEGWIASKTDWKGIKTTFAYNTAGQEISRIEAFGTPESRTITTDWHPTLLVKTKITEPEKETVYNYDANGKLLNQSIRSITVQ